VGTREVDTEAGRLETVDRLAVALIGIVPVSEQSARPCFDAERPRRAARARRCYLYVIGGAADLDGVELPPPAMR
jgi:hypothetical protein